MGRLKADVEQLVQKLVTEHGCNARLSKSGYWRITRPGYSAVTMSRTPSDQRAIRNMQADCRRFLGVDFGAS